MVLVGLAKKVDYLMKKEGKWLHCKGTSCALILNIFLVFTIISCHISNMFSGSFSAN